MGQRLEPTLFSVPTFVLLVDGHEVLAREYCTPELHARDVGLYGVGVYARTPPVIPITGDLHVFTQAQTVVEYHGRDVELLALLARVLGPELEPPALHPLRYVRISSKNPFS